METKTKCENDRPAPALGNEGNGATVGTDFEQPKIRICPHPYCGCISEIGTMRSGKPRCLHDGPCDPLDAAGRHFTISYTVEDGQTFMTRTYERKAPGRILDAETLQAAASIRASMAAIENTPFGSMQGDRVGS